VDNLLNTPPYNGDFTFFNLGVAMQAWLKGGGVNAAGPFPLYNTYIGGGNTGTAAINAIKLAMSAGNITSGSFYLYGVVEP
jgi:hypothetical protein